MQVLFEIIKNDTRKVVVSIDSYKGNNFLAIREMWRSSGEEEWMFSKKIVTMGYRESQEFMKKIKEVDDDYFFDLISSRDGVTNTEVSLEE